MTSNLQELQNDVSADKASKDDGKKFTHEPLRLSVFIEAPQQAIEDIIEQHDVVRQLVDNEWLHLLQIDPETLDVHRRRTHGV